MEESRDSYNTRDVFVPKEFRVKCWYAFMSYYMHLCSPTDDTNNYDAGSRVRQFPWLVLWWNGKLFSRMTQGPPVSMPPDGF